MVARAPVIIMVDRDAPAKRRRPPPIGLAA
jgi:hypothetical protein